MEFGYWDCQGSAEDTRMLAAYLNIDWNEWNPSSPQEWHQVRKPQFSKEGKLFPNLPYLVDGPNFITENSAIQLHLIYRAKREEMVGKIPEDQVTFLQVDGFIKDLIADCGKIYYNHNNTDAVAPLIALAEKVHPKLKGLDALIGNRPFVLNYLSIIDFKIAYWFDFIDNLVIMAPGSKPFFQDFQNIARVRSSFNELEAITQYHQKPENAKRIRYPPMIPFKMQ